MPQWHWEKQSLGGELCKQALVEVPRREPEMMSANRPCMLEQMWSSGKSTGLRYTKGQYPVLPK